MKKQSKQRPPAPQASQPGKKTRPTGTKKRAGPIKPTGPTKPVVKIGPQEPTSQLRAGQIERELGAPIPGVILPEEQWARTAVKRLPPPGPLDQEAMFGRTAPLVIDLGCGNGRFTLWSALTHPEWNHLAIDILPVVVRYATRRANQRGLHNVRVAVIGGRDLLRDYLAPQTVTEIHCYHPQPYYDPREIHLRLLTPEFLAMVHRTLVPGGRFIIQTDNPAYAKYIRSVLPAFFHVEELTGRWPEPQHGRTRREILALREGLPIYRAIATRNDELGEVDLAERLSQLPLPKFDADRRLARLDQLEQAADRAPAKKVSKKASPRRSPPKKKR